MNVPLTAKQMIEWLDFMFDEVIYPVELFLKIGIGGERPDGMLLSSGV